jgi:hypothetical protein
MKKKIRLTEQDLIKLVKRIIKESATAQKVSNMEQRKIFKQHLPKILGKFRGCYNKGTNYPNLKKFFENFPDVLESTLELGFIILLSGLATFVLSAVVGTVVSAPILIAAAVIIDLLEITGYIKYDIKRKDNFELAKKDKSIIEEAKEIVTCVIESPSWWY